MVILVMFNHGGLGVTEGVGDVISVSYVLL